MANSVFPDIDSAGGEIIRDASGCLAPPEVHNAYCPAPAFKSTCDLSALPSNCNARIEPRQVNAIVSELVSFAECIDPNGTWDCNSLKNLCTAFSAWALRNVTGVIISDTAPPPQQQGKCWWESDTGNFYIWYDDGNSGQWVQVNGSATVVDMISIIGSGSSGDPLSVALVDCGSY